jgi:hypothetical protein
MSKAWTLGCDEWYPVLSLDHYGHFGGEAEFTDEEIAELRALETKFNEWQRKIAERFGERHYEARTLVCDHKKD